MIRFLCLIGRHRWVPDILGYKCKHCDRKYGERDTR